MSWFSIRRQRGTPQIAGFYTVTGEALVVQVRWRSGGLVWNTPVAVHVQRRGHTQRHCIVDSTRLVQLGLAVATIVVVAQLWRQKEGDSHA